MLAERFGHSFCHEEIESRNRLSAMLLILVGLKDDGSQRSIALDALRGADTTVLCAETAFKEVIHIILDAGCRLCRIIIQVVDVNVSQLVRFGKTFRQQVFIGIIFSYFGSERHHLPGRRVTAHVGVAQIDIVLVDSHNAVHHLFHLGFLITLRIPPFAIDDVFLRYFRPHFHQRLFYQVLNLFYGDRGGSKLTDNIHGDVSNQLLLILNSTCTECFTDCILNLTDREIFSFTITFDDTNFRVVHNFNSRKH